MKNRTLFKAILILATASASVISVYAGSWNWTRPYKMPEKDVNTLIVIGNYRIPRMLADLIQAENKQPILLIPSDPDGAIFFMPAKDQTLKIDFEDMTDFIKYLNPGKIIVLGDNRYVPEKYLKAIDPSQTVISVTNKSWDKVAKTTTRILNLTYLDRRFREYEAKLKSGELYRPETVPEDQTPVITDEAPPATVVVEENNIQDTVITDLPKDDGKKEPADMPIAEPKLIDETEVVPK